MRTQFIPFPVLGTDRLQLRPLRPTDAPEIFLQRSDPRILEYVDLVPAKNLEDAEHFIRKINAGIKTGDWIFWGISLKNHSDLIGTICLWNLAPESATAELGYMLHPDFQGKGLMQEALAGVVTYAFDILQVQNMIALPQHKNVASIRLLERNHFVCTGDNGDYLIYNRYPLYAVEL